MSNEEIINCPCGEPVVVDKTDDWWFTSVTCNECESEVTGVDPDGSVHWSSARELSIQRAEMERQQFSADCNEMFGRGNHCF